MSNNSELIDESAIAAATAGFGAGLVPGLAALDTPAVAAIWVNMIVRLAIKQGRRDCTKAVAFSIAKGFMCYVVGTRILVAIFGVIPVVHFLVAGVNAALNYYYTRELGRATEKLLADGVPSGDIAKMAFNLITAPGLGELRHIWSDIKEHIA